MISLRLCASYGTQVVNELGLPLFAGHIEVTD